MMVFFLTSCEDFLDINQDPDQASVASDPEVLTSAQGFMTWIFAERIPQRSNIWSQYWAWGPGVAIGNAPRYIMEPTDMNNIWFRAYVNVAADLNYLNKSESPAYRGMAKVLQALLFSTLVDHFGTVPYFEAAQGAPDDGGITSPKFDAGDVIYADLLLKLDAARDELNQALVSGEVVGGEDLIYGGDLNHWVEFANSLKLKLLVRSVGTSAAPADLNAQVADAIAGGLIETSGDIAKIDFAGTAGSQNPLYASFESGVANFYVANTAVLDVMASLNDPRADYFFDAPAGGHVGLKAGEIDEINPQPQRDEFSTPSENVYGPAVPLILMSPWEVHFLRAEAALTAGSGEDDQAEFIAGVASSFEYCHIDNVTDYLEGVDYAADKMKSIATQKWLSMNSIQVVEGWTEARRLGIPELYFFTPFQSVLPDGVHPSIYIFPEDEVSLNSNTPTQQTVTDKVFWDN